MRLLGHCLQFCLLRAGVTGAHLVLSGDGSHGVFRFYPLPENPSVPEGCFQVAGVFNPEMGALAVLPTCTWYLKPRDYLPAAFGGTVVSPARSSV